ncbi:hypothetical protein OESDEN_17559 [Oesophagostomum dentatum]|uniref:Uncharacterized protein n=1 Tax=Oesophagostomum dentatum TaxID=61180 RepID=A0A0B1SFT3_OESDE|nr:hypothetical protein OESDEN_17559 [Oesophagostomum dentatum]
MTKTTDHLNHAQYTTKRSSLLGTDEYSSLPHFVSEFSPTARSTGYLIQRVLCALLRRLS